MDGWLKVLVAMTCLAVLTATGWWGWSEWRASDLYAARVQAEQDRIDELTAELAEKERLRQEAGPTPPPSPPPP